MMPSHFSTIGFAVTSTKELLEVTERARAAAVPIAARSGFYLHWSSASGAELWLQVNDSSQLIGVHPHFGGSTTSSVMVDRIVKRDDQTELDAALHGWMNPDQDGSGGDYPLVVDCANYFAFSREAPPAQASLQISAFAHEISTFESAVEFNEVQQRDGGLQYASQSFIPSGTFSGDEPPQAQALFCGHVLTSGKRVNDLSGQSFYWAEVETYGGTLDVVADQSLVTFWPSTGGVIKGTFWLSARIGSMHSRASFLRRMLWRARTAG